MDFAVKMAKLERSMNVHVIMAAKLANSRGCTLQTRKVVAHHYRRMCCKCWPSYCELSSVQCVCRAHLLIADHL